MEYTESKTLTQHKHGINTNNNRQNGLISLATRTLQERQQIGSLGGSISSPNKKLAAKLRELKKKGLNDLDAMAIYESITDSELSAVQIAELMLRYQKDVKTLQQLEKLIQLKQEFHKLQHGSKSHQTIDLTTKSFEFKIDLINAQKPEPKPINLQTEDTTQQDKDTQQ